MGQIIIYYYLLSLYSEHENNNLVITDGRPYDYKILRVLIDCYDSRHTNLEDHFRVTVLNSHEMKSIKFSELAITEGGSELNFFTFPANNTGLGFFLFSKFIIASSKLAIELVIQYRRKRKRKNKNCRAAEMPLHIFVLALQESRKS